MVRGIKTARQVEGRAGPVPAHLLGYLLQGLEALGQLGRPRARSIAGLFPWPPSEPDMKLVASSGSPVSFSPKLWPIVVYVVMTSFAERDALAFA